MRALVRDPGKERASAPADGVLTTDFATIRDDPSIGVVAELMGGIEPARTHVLELLAAGKPVVTDGPFTESKEVLGGYWMIDVKSREEAIAWASKCPASENEIIEIRQVHEMSDFPEEIQQAAAGFTELQGNAARR